MGMQEKSKKSRRSRKREKGKEEKWKKGKKKKARRRIPLSGGKWKSAERSDAGNSNKIEDDREASC